MADWHALQIKIPGKDLLEPVTGILETLVIFLDILKTILQSVDMFLIDFGNPLRALIDSLVKLIKQLFASLKLSGLYLYLDVPDPKQDPKFNRYLGGYQAFTQRFFGSLVDARDTNRPQPTPGVTKSGFTIILADASDVFALNAKLSTLMDFFGKDFRKPKYLPPGNPKLLVAGAKPGSKAAKSGTVDPMLNVASVFGANIKGLVLEWGPSSNTQPPDPGFTDLLGSVGAEFIPQKFLIERTSRKNGPDVKYQLTEATFESKTGQRYKRKAKCVDEYGDVFRTFEKYIVVSGPLSLVEGALGKFRYLDTDVKADTTYYYRVRAFSGTLVPNSDGTLTFPPAEMDPQTLKMTQKWSENPDVVMGQPTTILANRVPTIPKDFDVINQLEALFLTAFSLGFHLPVDPGDSFDSITGLPKDGTIPAKIGRGSLLNLGSVLGSLIPKVPVLNLGDGGSKINGSPEPPKTKGPKVDPVTKAYPDVYWNSFLVKQHSQKMAQTVGSALLENSSMIPQFRKIMEGALRYPFSAPTDTYLAGVTTPGGLVTKFVTLPQSTVDAKKNTVAFPMVYDPKVYATYSYAYTNSQVRLDVLAVISFIKSFTLQGVPPDWVSASILRDIVPWSGKLLYDLLARMDALLDAFKSVTDEIQAFVALITRKIDVLERFVKYLLSILDFLAKFTGGFYILSVPSTDGGIPDWISLTNGAGGEKPSSGPGGYSAGLVLAYVNPDVEAFAKALDILF